ncbi:MAG: type III pantothenate kinase [candidate division WOR-3 bacterium]
MKTVAVDIGNSKIKIGLISKDIVKKVYTFDPNVPEKILKFSPERIYAISVNKRNKKIFEQSFSRKFDFDVFFLEKRKNLFESEYSFENIGIDRFVSVYYAIKRKLYPSLVVDLGTADTYDFIDEKGKHLGGFISAGLETISNALEINTDNLFKVEASTFDEKIGKNTEQALKNGIFLQWISGVLTFIGFGKKILGDSKIIITGGNSCFVQDYVKDAVFDKHFLLKAINEYGKDFFSQKC